MNFTQTSLPPAYLIDVKRIADDRGFFGRSFCINEMEQHGLNTNIIQANVAATKNKGTLRGLHLQVAPFEETKLVRCTRGAIFDVIVDLRLQSPKFKQWFGVTLTAESFTMLYVPEGFAHGYLTLEDDTEVMYQVSQMYTPAAERGYRWNDPAFNIAWPVEPRIISEKDKAHPLFETTLSLHS